MGKKRKEIQIDNIENVKQIHRKSSDVISHTTARFGGSDDEKKALNIYENSLKNMGVKTFTHSFTVRPHSKYGWIYFVSTFTLLAHILFFFAPAFAIASLAIGLLTWLCTAVFNIPILSPLFDKFVSHNSWAELSPSQTVKARLILSTHIDNRYEHTFSKMGGVALDLAIFVVVIVANILMLALSIVTCAIQSGVGVVQGPLLYIGLAFLIFAPVEICLYFAINFAKVDTHNGNLNACDVLLSCTQQIIDQPMQNLQVVTLFLGSKENNLQGAKEFVIHDDFDKDIPTYVVDLDNLESTNINISSRELPYGEKPSKRLSSVVSASCNQNDITVTAKDQLFACRQSTVFRRQGFDSVSLASNNENTLTDDDIQKLATMLTNVAYTMDNNLNK